MKNNYLINKCSEKSGIALHFCKFFLNLALIEDTWILICFCIQSVLIEAYEENVASQICS